MTAGRTIGGLVAPTMVHTAVGWFRRAAADPALPPHDQWQFECPGCGRWAWLDADQWSGRVSVQHDCGYHETRDYAAAFRAAGGGDA